MLANSKDAIKSRMIRNASGIWGYQDTEDINSFDPIVGMIIGALAEEIYNVSEEIKKTDARIVEKLFDLLINQDVFTHFPAHALVKAKTTQPQVSISELYQFNFIKKVPKTVKEETVYTNKTICFTPTTELRLFKGEVKYFAAGNQIFEILDQVKEPLANAEKGIVFDFSRLYIGLKLDNTIDKIDGLSLMFSIKNKLNEGRFYNSISNATWKINNKDVDFRQGFELPQHAQDKSLDEIFRKETDISYKTCRYVNEFYRSKFMTIENHNYFLKDFIKSDSLPEELKRKFPGNILKPVPRDIFWIEIQLSQPVSSEIINDLTVLLNSFPVVNREINEFSQLLTRGINIIPLTTEDLFFDIKSISDTRGTLYKPFHSYGSENANEEGYMIRHGGIARFDSRDAKETINHLIDLIRDERASFALLGTDLISSELIQLDQIISRLKQRLETNNVRDDSNSYLILNCNSNFERANVQFWTTSGELANSIRSNSKLTIQNGSDLDTNSVIMITNSFGARQKLSKEDKLNRLRRMLLSKGRVVTKEDIKALCFEHFGTELSEVEIKKGVYLDPSPQKGLVRSLDVFLKLDTQDKLTGDELEQKINELKIILKQESLNLLPFRVFIR
ncbi:MAG: hypothetical protein A2V46_00345 [Bacteroidetes bacterium RBG_19FT_COMBO_42_7]|nr:MAG: hypothetical protein A2V46_00345 [Bacteroidetes bacterium RBG_19FT_COMBO_42_7]